MFLGDAVPDLGQDQPRADRVDPHRRQIHRQRAGEVLDRAQHGRAERAALAGAMGVHAVGQGDRAVLGDRAGGVLDRRDGAPEANGEHRIGGAQLKVRDRAAGPGSPIAGGIGQVVEAAQLLEEPRHRGLVGHVDRRAPSTLAQPLDRGVDLGLLARGDDHLRAVVQRRLGHRVADAGAASDDDDDLPVQICGCHVRCSLWITP